MSDFENIAIDSLQRQYLYTNIAKLCVGKGIVYDKYIGNLTENFFNQVFNIDTCSSNALDFFWGKILKVSRVFYNSNDNQEFTLTDDEFREILHLRSFATNWDGCLASLNLFMFNLFKKRGVCQVIDALNMTSLIFSFDFKLEDWEIYLFRNSNILPRPAGVGSEISIIDTDIKYFGFKTYNQIIESPITIGFRTYDNTPMGEGQFLTYSTIL